MRAQAIFVGGTASHVGKSWMATAICGYLKRRGLRVAPFKAQNMSNNSFPCAAGGEIGRAQVAQAEACGLAPEPDMNPILLKPTSDQSSQVVLNGRAIGTVPAREYYAMHGRMLEVAQQAYDRLAARFDYIVIEGAGSVAEMNLKHRDVVNTAMARYADARGLLVADIDRGGVFASLCGSLDLLEPWERALFRAFAVNRFRGDRMLFDDGVSFLEKRTGLACLGVFPMSTDIELDAEDGVNLEGTGSATSDIAVIRFPHVSNFTDFRLLPCQWISRPIDQTFRWVILPGTKNTMGDLDWLHQRGLAEWVLAQHRHGASILGVCGGYQMLGREIEDPYGVESHGPRSMNGLGLLPVRTVLEREKVTRCVAARTPGGRDFGAYEIHTGQTDRAGLAPFACLEDGTPEGVRDDRVCGTYLHGALESPAVVREWFGLDLRAATKDYDRLTDWFVSAIAERVFEDLYL